MRGVRVRPGVRVEVALPLRRRSTVVVLHPHRHVALAVGDRGAHERVGAQLVAVARLGDAVLHIDLHTLKILLHDEVRDAADGVGAVHRRGAARDDLDAVDHCCRDGVDVGHHQGVDRGRAVTVDQHQAAVGAEAAQRDGGDADGVDGRGLHVKLCRHRSLGRVVVRQCVQVRLEIQAGSLLDLIGADRDQGAARLEVGPPDARAGDCYLLELRGRGIRALRSIGIGR